MLWVDKHRPTSLDKLDYHKEQAAQLKELVRWPAIGACTDFIARPFSGRYLPEASERMTDQAIA